MRKFLLSLLWVATAAFGQIYTFPAGQEKSHEFKTVVAWIASFDGGPDCSKVIRYKSDPYGPDGRFYYTAQAICVKAGFADLQLDAALLLRHPAVSLIELKNAFRFGDPSKYENFRYIVESAPPAPDSPTPLPPQPDNPIGPEFSPGLFFSIAGDVKPAGYIYSDPTTSRVFRKTCRNQLGSAQSCWYNELQ